MRTLAVITLLITTSCAVADHCRLSEARNEVIDGAGVDRVFVEASAGSLRITGVSEGSQIRVRGTACSDTRRSLELIKLRTIRDGSALRLIVDIPDRVDGRYDLDIELPRAMILDVEDGSGAATIRNVAALKITDGSGELVITDVAGAVSVRDGSGSLDVQRTGDLTIEDGSGDITARDINGTFLVNLDGSGSIDVRNVSRDVIVERDGSGSIEVADVKGDFRVASDGSGGVSHHGVAGNVNVR